MMRATAAILWAAAVHLSTTEAAVVLGRSLVVARSRACVACSLPAERPRSLPLGPEDGPLLEAPMPGRLAARLARVRKWARAALTSAVLVGGVSAPAALAARKMQREVEKPRAMVNFGYTKEPKQLSSQEALISTVMASAMAVGLLYYAKVATAEDDKAEIKQIKDETERLKKVRQEFLMDDEVVQDDDLFSSLRKRMEKAGEPGVPTEPQGPDADMGPADEGPDDLLDPPPQPPKPTPMSPTSTAEPPAPGRTGADAPPTGSSPAARQARDAELDEPPEDAAARDADIERLKRMFGN